VKDLLSRGMITFCEQAKEIVGGPSALARLLGNISPQAVSQWRRVPIERVFEVERVTGISRHLLRPDIFGSVRDLQNNPPPPKSVIQQSEYSH
jgi:DNA-binding transcriptional regulator YdaS (Cro superfamily)